MKFANTNQEESLDLLSQLQIPSWMMRNINELQDSSIFLDNQNPFITPQPQQNLALAKHDHVKTKPHASYQIQWNQNSKNSDNSENESDESSEEKKFPQKISLITKKESKNKQQRRNQTSRKYRQRKKQYSKNIQNQNKFLRFKIDQLTFRLHQVTTELSKLKNTPQKQNVPNYHKVKSQCFEQLENMLQNKVRDASQYLEIEKKLSSVVAFDGKQKIDLLNYFMSELMENVITDKAFYFIDCMINKKGVHRPNDSVKLSPMDTQIFEMIKIQDPKKQFAIKRMCWKNVGIESQKFQQLWKKLYQVYLAILNQGFKIQRMFEKVKGDLKNLLDPFDMLRLELYFEKNKYRSDIREMRNLWFRQLERENSVSQMKKMSNK